MPNARAINRRPIKTRLLVALIAELATYGLLAVMACREAGPWTGAALFFAFCGIAQLRFCARVASIRSDQRRVDEHMGRLAANIQSSARVVAGSAVKAVRRAD